MIMEKFMTFIYSVLVGKRIYKSKKGFENGKEI